MQNFQSDAEDILRLRIKKSFLYIWRFAKSFKVREFFFVNLSNFKIFLSALTYFLVRNLLTIIFRKFKSILQMTYVDIYMKILVCLKT